MGLVKASQKVATFRASWPTAAGKPCGHGGRPDDGDSNGPHRDEAGERPVVEKGDNDDGQTGRLIPYDTEGGITEVWESLDAQRQPPPRLIHNAGVLTRGEFGADSNCRMDPWLSYHGQRSIRAEGDQNGGGKVDAASEKQKTAG